MNSRDWSDPLRWLGVLLLIVVVAGSARVAIEVTRGPGINWLAAILLGPTLLTAAAVAIYIIRSKDLR